MTQTSPMVVSLLRCLASLRLSLYRRLQWAHPSMFTTAVDVVADPGSTVTFLKSVPAAAVAVGLAEAEATAEAATTAFRVAEVAAVEFCEMSCFRLY